LATSAHAARAEAALGATASDEKGSFLARPEPSELASGNKRSPRRRRRRRRRSHNLTIHAVILPATTTTRPQWIFRAEARRGKDEGKANGLLPGARAGEGGVDKYLPLSRLSLDLVQAALFPLT